MPRAKRGFKARRRRNRVLKHAKGFYGARSRYFGARSSRSITRGPMPMRIAACRKRDFRRLWITRISAAAKSHGSSYSKLIGALKTAASSSTARSWPTSLRPIRVASRPWSTRLGAEAERHPMDKAAAFEAGLERSAAELPRGVRRGPRRASAARRQRAFRRAERRADAADEADARAAGRSAARAGPARQRAQERDPDGVRARLAALASAARDARADRPAARRQLARPRAPARGACIRSRA